MAQLQSPQLCSNLNIHSQSTGPIDDLSQQNYYSINQRDSCKEEVKLTLFHVLQLTIYFELKTTAEFIVHL